MKSIRYTYFDTFIICIATGSVLGSIGLLPYFVPWLKGKILCRSVDLTEEDLKNADSEKSSEVEKKSDPFQKKPSGKIHGEVRQETMPMEDFAKKARLVYLINSQDEPTVE